MKKAALITLAAALLLPLGACSAARGSGSSFLARINAVDGGSSITVTPDMTSSERGSADIFTVTIAPDTRILDASGNEIDLGFLTPGEDVTITYDGRIEESYPARITARSIAMKNGVVSGSSAHKKDTVTYVSGGESRTVEADRVTLAGCRILVPSNGWKAQSAEGTRVGPVIISPTENAGVSVTFRVYEDEDADGAKALLPPELRGAKWQTWSTDAGAEGVCASSEDADRGRGYAYLLPVGGGTAAVICRCPADMSDEYGQLLSRIAATLTAD